MNFPWRLVGCGTIAVLLAACGRQPAAPGATAAAQEATARRKVVLQTDWFPQAEHGGFYQALAKGFYAEAGLDVEIWPGGPGAGIKLKVARGDADFGMQRSDDLIVAAARGLPFLMVATTMQHDPQAVMVHDENPVRTLRDLAGRTVIASPSMTWIPYLKKKYGIEFHLKPNTYGLGEFRADRTAIQQCYVTNEPFFAQQHGLAVRTLALAEAGYDCYPAIFCRKEFAKTSPEAVRAFVGATIRGWRDYLQGDPAPADALILARNRDMTAALLKFSRDQMIARKLVEGDAAKGEDVGTFSLARVAQQAQMLLELKLLDAPVPVADVATTEFLPVLAN
jgi:NitT/TauT family transport system substrate-binding protein